jgi:uncharacterized membrane protein
MATEKQIAANRQNAQKSTGPTTERGKRRSRRNAIRHGLMAETVIDVLEDAAAYKALQRAIHSDYRPRSNFELELVGRLASLLWRLRRAVAIESGILNIQANALQKQMGAPVRGKLEVFYRQNPSLAPATPNDNTKFGQINESDARPNIARSFLRLNSLGGTAFERLGRYEKSLWRQTIQTVVLLNSINDDSNGTFSSRHSSFRTEISRPARQIRWPPFLFHPSD